MKRDTLIEWEERIRSAPTNKRMAIIHDFADSLDGDEGKVATSFLRMVTMANDPETKNIERKASADRLLFQLGFGWQILLLVALAGGLVMVFYEKLAETELTIGDVSVKTSSIGLVLVLIAVIGGGRVVIRAIENLRHE